MQHDVDVAHGLGCQASGTNLRDPRHDCHQASVPAADAVLTLCRTLLPGDP